MRRSQAEPIIAVAVLLTLGAIAVAAGLRRNQHVDLDPRLTTYGTGPAGARGLAETLQRLGVRVVRSRVAPGSATEADPRAPLALLDPSIGLGLREGIAVAKLAETRDLMLVGSGASNVMRCFGYRVRLVVPTGDSTLALLPGPPADSVRLRGLLVRDTVRTVVDSAARDDRIETSCVVPVPVRTDTLLASVAGQPVLLRLTLDGDRRILLAGDGALFSNARVRRPTVGTLVVAALADRDSTLVVDEYHHGFGVERGGSPARTLLAWSLTTPWGWAVWQLVAVGLVALIAGGVRFGPLIPLARARRREPLEHVRALATALGAAAGHGEGARWIVRGLRRRLGRGTAARDDLAWLATLRASVRTPRARDAVYTLTTTLRDPGPDAPQRAAAAADILWEELQR